MCLQASSNDGSPLTFICSCGQTSRWHRVVNAAAIYGRPCAPSRLPPIRPLCPCTPLLLDGVIGEILARTLALAFSIPHLLSPLPISCLLTRFRRVPLPESLLNDESGSDSDVDNNSNHRRDPVERSEVAAGSFSHSSSAGGSSSRSSSSCGDGSSGSAVAAPRVVDRLRRTRAAAAAISIGGGGNK